MAVCTAFTKTDPIVADLGRAAKLSVIYNYMCDLVTDKSVELSTHVDISTIGPVSTE